MIIESRSILFSDEELLVALRPILTARQEDPEIVPDRVVCDMDEEDEIIVTYHMPGGEHITFNNREVGAAVLNHCIEVGIPLPRGSYKELAIRGDHLGLIVRLESGVVGPGVEDDNE